MNEVSYEKVLSIMSSELEVLAQLLREVSAIILIGGIGGNHYGANSGTSSRT